MNTLLDFSDLKLRSAGGAGVSEHQYRSEASYAGLVVSSQRHLHGGLRSGGNLTVARAYDQVTCRR